MSFTPQIIELADGLKCVLLEDYKKLEQERDAARELLASEKITRNHIIEKGGAIEKDRDEAREELRDIRLNLGADAEGYTLLHAVCVIQNERDELQKLLNKIGNPTNPL
jgi:hypothetical protein